MRPYIRDPKLWATKGPSWAGTLDTTDDIDPNLPPRPLPNSYWATPTLLASEYPGPPTKALAILRLTALLDVGITDFFDLTEEGELVPYSSILERLVSDRSGRFTKVDITRDNYSSVFQDRSSEGDGESLSVGYAKFPIRDGSIPSTDQLKAVLDAFSMVHTQEGRKAVVHCWGGIGRTGTIVGCWLVHSGVVRDEEEAVAVQGEPSSMTGSGAVGTASVTALSSGVTVSGEEQVPAAFMPRVRQAGDIALEVLARKWKGVHKSWRVPRTPENARQTDMLNLLKRRMTRIPDLPSRPLPNSYWATPTLLASERPGDSRENVAVPRLNALLEEWESLPYFPILERLVSEKGGQVTKLDPASTISNGEGLLVRYARFPIRDGSVPSPEVLQSIMDALNTVQQQHDRRAVFHCWGGIGRTGTIVGCSLVYSGAVSDEEALVTGRQAGVPSAAPNKAHAEGYIEPSHANAAARIRSAGEVALAVLEKKWKEVDKSWKALRTPENALQEDMVRSFKSKKMIPSLQ
ncbi:hypothetical protein FRC00_002526 [Tulasnella sp. 408]|nr:hypothetical protein FRC00_002526 [Tulasnella sp. 408]